MSISRDDLLKVLGFRPGSNPSWAEIKKAYKTKAKEFHPDLNKEPGATEKFKAINIAMMALSGKGTDTKSKIQNINKDELWKVYKWLVRDMPLNYRDDTAMAAYISQKMKEFPKTFPKMDEQISALATDILKEKHKTLNRPMSMSYAEEEFREMSHAAYETTSEREEKIAHDKAIQRMFNWWIKDYIPTAAKMFALGYNLNDVQNIARYKEGKKPYVPITYWQRGKRVAKFILLTAGVLVAILGGKYIFDRSKGAYTTVRSPIRGYLSHIPRRRKR